MAQKNLVFSDPHERRKLVDHDHLELSVSRQCELMGLGQVNWFRSRTLAWAFP
jgi:hypothetical protein